MKAQHRITVTMEDDGRIHTDSHMVGDHVFPSELHALNAALVVELGSIMTRLLGLHQHDVSESFTVEPDDEVK